MKVFKVPILHDIRVVGCCNEDVELPKAVQVVLEVGGAVRENQIVPNKTVTDLKMLCLYLATRMVNIIP